MRKTYSVKYWLELLQQGITPVVQFSESVVSSEHDFEPQMRARLVNYKLRKDPSGCTNVTFVFDFREFAEYNKQFEIANYYDEDGKPRLRWSETTFYPRDFRTTYCYDLNDADSYFFPVDEGSEKLVEIWKKQRESSETDLSYVQWLEKQVLQSM